MGFGVGTARTMLSTATIFMDSSPGLSQGARRASRPRVDLGAAVSQAMRRVTAARPGRPPYNGSTMPGWTSTYDAGAVGYDRLTGQWSWLSTDVERFVRLVAVAPPLDLPNVYTDRILDAAERATVEGRGR